MDNINNILNDESPNDKELIKELYIYIKNHINKKKPINKQLVIDLTDIVSRNSEIYFGKAEFVNRTQFSAYWNNNNEKMIINMTLTLSFAKKVKNKSLNSKVGDNNIFMYYYILTTIIHELTHARQYYLSKNENNNIYNSCQELIKEKYDVYVKNHFEIPTERYANLRAQTLTYEVLSYIYPIRKIQEFRRLIYIYLLIGYKVKRNEKLVELVYEKELPKEFEIISAIDYYNRVMEENSLPKVNIITPNDITLYERLYLGLPISAKEYHQLDDLYYDIYDNTKKEKVKELINKL